MTILVEPINWEDNLGSSPPAQWQAVEEDNRYWITNNGDPYAVSQQRIDYIGEVSDLPTSLTFAWEIVTAPTEYEGDVIFFYNKGAGLDQINLGNEVGSGEVTVDLTGWDGFYWGVKVENIGFSSYGAVIAVGDVTAAADDFNCEEIGRATRAYVSAYDRSRVHQARLYRFEKRCLIANFNGAIPSGRTIATATWRTDAPEIGVMSDPTISTSGREANVMFATQLGGSANLRCEVTLDNGEIYNQAFRVNVREASSFFNDPPSQPGPFSVTVSAE